MSSLTSPLPGVVNAVPLSIPSSGSTSLVLATSSFLSSFFSSLSVDKEATVDPEKTASTKTNMGAMATILILALGGVAAYYYFKIYKPKKEEDEDDQPEGLETGGLEEIPDEEESEDEDFEENEK